MDYEAHKSIYKILPSVRLVGQAAVDQVSVDFRERHYRSLHERKSDDI